MKRRRLFKNKEKRQRMVHIMAGVMILIHAFEKYTSGHGNPLFFAISGLVFLSIAIFHPVLEKKFPWVDGVFFFIEGLLSVTVALDFFHEGKKGLPWVYLFLCLFQFFLAFFKSAKGIRHHQAKHAGDHELLIADGSLQNVVEPLPAENQELPAALPRLPDGPQQ